MFSPKSADIPAVLILILLAERLRSVSPADCGKVRVSQSVVCESVGQRTVKVTCTSSCSSGLCYYDWFRGSTPIGCSYAASLWVDSSSSSDQGSYSCSVYNYFISSPYCELVHQQWGVTYSPERVCALKGSSVDFSCSYKHPAGLTVNTSVWFLQSRVQHGTEPTAINKNRVKYEQNQTHSRLRITDLRESDSDEYRFRFYTDDPGGKYTGEPGVTLNVTELKVTVSDTERGVKKLNCSASCVLSEAVYVWYKNGEPVSNENRNELDLNRTVGGGSYSCAVKEHEDLRSPAVCVESLQVKVDGAAASEEKNVTLTCITSTCTPLNNPDYIWYKNETPVSHCVSASCSVAVVSEVVRYSCALKDRGLLSPPVYSPKNTSMAVLPPGETVEGGAVTLTCSSDANPPVVTYSWFNQTAADTVLGKGQNYSISLIRPQHRGQYYCSAHNQLGHSRSEPTRLDVLYPPRRPSLSEDVFNGSVTLLCVSDSNPASTYTWFRNTGRDVQQFGRGSNLTLAPGTDGVFYCEAQNQLGSSTSTEWTFNSGLTGLIIAVSGVFVVLLLGFIAVCLWMRRRAAASSSKRESSGQGAEMSVAVISDSSAPESSDLQDDVQYSSVHFIRTQPQEVPRVHQPIPSHQEEEVQYATVNTAKPRTNWSDEAPIYSTIQRK